MLYFAKGHPVAVMKARAEIRDRESEHVEEDNSGKDQDQAGNLVHRHLEKHRPPRRGRKARDQQGTRSPTRVRILEILERG